MRRKSDRTVLLQVKISPRMHRWLETEARGTDLTMGDLVRRAVRETFGYDACTCGGDDAAGAPGARVCPACAKSGGLPLADED